MEFFECIIAYEVVAEAACRGMQKHGTGSQALTPTWKPIVVLHNASNTR